MARSRKPQIVLNVLPVADLATGGAVLTAAQLQRYSMAVLTQNTAGQVGTLPAFPLSGAMDFLFKLDAASTANFTVLGKVLRPGQAASFIWDGAAWSTADVESSLMPLVVPTSPAITADAAGVVSVSTATTASVFTVPGSTSSSYIESLILNQQTITALSGALTVTQANPCTFVINDSADLPLVGDSVAVRFIA